MPEEDELVPARKEPKVSMPELRIAIDVALDELRVLIEGTLGHIIREHLKAIIRNVPNPEQEEETTAFAQGYDTLLDGGQMEANPYTAPGQEKLFFCWEEGWKFAANDSEGEVS